MQGNCDEVYSSGDQEPAVEEGRGRADFTRRPEYQELFAGFAGAAYREDGERVSSKLSRRYSTCL